MEPVSAPVPGPGVSAAHVTALRSFNRYFTRRIGVLDDHYLGQDRPLGEARLLYEIGAGASLRELRTRLGLDAGYLSRMVRALEKQGLVRVTVHPADSRLRLAEPTPAGRAELAEQNRRADDLAEGLLRGLTETQRGRLTEAVAVTERLLRLAAITVRPVGAASPDARACLAAYAAELDGRFPEGYAATDLVPPERIAALLVAYEEERAVGCGALCALDAGTAEIRHLWVHPQARGLGLGHRLLTGLEQVAAERGHRVVRLDTHKVLKEAAAMYRSGGYTEIPAYDDNPHAGYWFEKPLTPVGEGPGTH
ncbi:MarR family transcriptional regulator/GNAT family N-acetyltransferase [Streptomyces sp. BH-SS-21]|uniref:MarR family transcriptional regulator/GNAT family N-acetyltransferase n=1 Tax=Streptomyces liliiviolaceus TaxID=2823109 RepID=A0A940XJ42_9ACTN|nr:bifunctional helix-turn-helix transcriptional regulator/GNAT family N-acetyltransferase [Streptomyces liliiviolaceus]MBQ0846964.1 MarR family transcriptional regulator/GNAT family N-acetyltransferase [Streptomyces liliiviolaceus]